MIASETRLSFSNIPVILIIIHTISFRPILVETHEGICAQPMREGHGSETIDRFYYNSSENKCLPFTFRGRGGNKNRFRTIDECQDVCM
ncbi:unnamed protein product [Schistosoma curassoni]|uniref:BPTI/Kunitz inhibitor domain-containing protein n=1 Tax=Schistosoma curassoni TaxID=6186 RepID=A0A183JQ31_9TREM|nr:unnamed protein product [Schistosoma curassoni]